MISRVAGCCFWMHRYVERAENVARLLKVNRSFVLDVPVDDMEKWHPVVIVAGEEQRFGELFPAASAHDGEVVEEEARRIPRGPVGARATGGAARRTARTRTRLLQGERRRRRRARAVLKDAGGAGGARAAAAAARPARSSSFAVANSRVL